MAIIIEIIKQTVVQSTINTNGRICNYYNSDNGCLYCNSRESVPYNNEMNYLQTSKLLDFSNNSFIL